MVHAHAKLPQVSRFMLSEVLRNDMSDFCQGIGGQIELSR